MIQSEVLWAKNWEKQKSSEFQILGMLLPNY